MKIPSRPRYDMIMESVVEFLDDEDVIDFPIDPFKIIAKHRWGLCSYSQLAEENGVDIDAVIEAYQTKDACVIRNKRNYTIAYNDTIEVPERIRFTLMHEIGHIKLNHLVDFKETTLNRGGLTKQEYDVLEREANAFARNVLSPPVIVSIFMSKFKRTLVDDISGCFSISRTATKTRLQMLDWDLSQIEKYVPKIIVKFQNFISKVLDSKQCVKCKHFPINRFAAFCPICKSRKFTKEKGESLMIYNGFETTEGRVHICPWCENEEISVTDNFCKICSTPVVNQCTGSGYDEYNDYWECKEVADGKSRFCTKCGSQTVFFQRGLLKSWEQEIEDRELEKQKELKAVFADIPF